MTTSNTNIIRLHRVLQAPPERVYRAFLDTNAMVKWLPPNGFTGQVHQLDAKVGGSYRMSFTNFTTGKSHSFGGEYLELTPNERIRHTDRFDDANLCKKRQVFPLSQQIVSGNSAQHVCKFVRHIQGKLKSARINQWANPDNRTNSWFGRPANEGRM
jgi:uncharacterized protein YndB with AHSA1/START domain